MKSPKGGGSTAARTDTNRTHINKTDTNHPTKATQQMQRTQGSNRGRQCKLCGTDPLLLPCPLLFRCLRSWRTATSGALPSCPRGGTQDLLGAAYPCLMRSGKGALTFPFAPAHQMPVVSFLWFPSCYTVPFFWRLVMRCVASQRLCHHVSNSMSMSGSRVFLCLQVIVNLGKMNNIISFDEVRPSTIASHSCLLLLNCTVGLHLQQQVTVQRTVPSVQCTK